MNLGPLEIFAILLVVVILFGVGRISKIGKEMGSGIRGFREGLQGDDSKKAEETAAKMETEKPEEPKS